MGKKRREKKEKRKKRGKKGEIRRNKRKKWKRKGKKRREKEKEKERHGCVVGRQREVDGCNISETLKTMIPSGRVSSNGIRIMYRVA